MPNLIKVGLLLLLLLAPGAGFPDAPCPPSELIADITLDWKTLKVLAPGSDNWPLTWGADDNMYATWGDGGGFGGTNSEGRVSLGLARILGEKCCYEGQNIWGGNEPEAPATLTGKSYGLLSLDTFLYMFFGPGSGAASYTQTHLARSLDDGHTWEQADWAFTQVEGLAMPAFCQFGRGYEGARDEYVYAYFLRLDGKGKWDCQRPGRLDLLRAPRSGLWEAEKWQAFAGFAETGAPLWTQELSARQPVFEDAAGAGPVCSVIYNAGLKRYLLMTEHGTTHQGNLGLFEAQEPWGPWHTVKYWDGLALPGQPPTLFYGNFAPKWTSQNGQRFVLVLTGTGEADAWNSVEGRFKLYERQP